jgi:ribulose-5-phosphate 4-epimerase/fuculose-1-phosphate aldolase
VMDSPYPVSPAGFVIHSAIHAARENAKCVLHTHTVHAVAVSAQKCGVLPISQQSAFILSSLGYHDYEGVAVRDDEKPRLVRDLGDNMFLMLRNHGLLTVGPSIADAFVNMYLFESVCRIQVLAQSCGGDLVTVDSRIIAGAKERAKKATSGMSAGTLNWPGLLRRLDRTDSTFRN